MQFSLKCSTVPSLFACQVWWQNSKAASSIWGLKVGWGGFRLCDAISRKWCEIKLRWQLITNRKSHLSIATQIDNLEWPWMSIHCCVVSVMCVVTKSLRVESRDFHYIVALYFSYLHIKFDDEIKRKFKFQAYCTISLRPKLKWRLCYALSTVRVSFYTRLSHASVCLYTETAKAQTTL